MSVAIPVVPEVQKSVVRIEAIEVSSGDYGDQIQVTFMPTRPDAVSGFFRWFPLSSNPRSKWMRFVNSFNQARGKAIADVSEMIGTVIELTDKEESGEIGGELKTWSIPLVVAVKPEGEAELSSGNGKAKKKGQVPADVAKLIEQTYEAVGRDGKKTWAQFKDAGYTQRAIKDVLDAYDAKVADADSGFFGDNEEEVLF